MLDRSARSVTSRLLLAALLAFGALFGSLPGSVSAQTAQSWLADVCTRMGVDVRCTYTFTGHEERFVVPAGVKSMNVEAIGGAGGFDPDPRRGRSFGGRVTVAGLGVVPGQALYVAVGGDGGRPRCSQRDGGAGGWNGGGPGGGSPVLEDCPNSAVYPGMGGGGASDVRTHSRDDASRPLTGDRASDPRVLVAGGGGGSARLDFAGGSAGVPSVDAAHNGDGEQGLDRYGRGSTALGGFGGTATAGGQPGYGNSPFSNLQAHAGGAGAGGRGEWGPSGFIWPFGGGGGGGGWFGGGGGTSNGNAANVGGGGGGSSMVPEGGTIEPPSAEAARVVFTFTLPLDATAPTVSVTAPQDGTTYVKGSRVLAAFACADEPDGWGLKTCTGTTNDGDPIDTSTAGAKTFIVTATDEAGNETTKTLSYTVVEFDGTPAGGYQGDAGSAAPAISGGAPAGPQSTAAPSGRPAAVRVLSARLASDGTVIARVAAPGAGTVIGLATVPGASRRLYAERRVRVSKAQTVTLRIKPSAAMRKKLARRKGAIKLRLTLAFDHPPDDLVRVQRTLRVPPPKGGHRH